MNGHTLASLSLHRHGLAHLDCPFAACGDDDVPKRLGQEAGLAVCEVVLPLTAKCVDLRLAQVAGVALVVVVTQQRRPDSDVEVSEECLAPET